MTRWFGYTTPLMLVAVTFVASAATPPTTVNYQGVLRNASDKPLAGTYDMLLSFYDAATAGTQIMTDQHAAASSNAVTVSGGLFNVQLGGGTVADGSGAGTYTNLADVFRDYGAVYLEIKVGTETLTPRVRMQSSAYALNATNLSGRAASGYLDTSATSQTKNGPLTISVTGGGQIGLYATGQSRAGWFQNVGNFSESKLATDNGYGVYGYGPTAGGYFVNSVNSTNGTLAATDYVIQGTGATGGAYLVQSGGLGQAKIAYGNYGIIGNGSAAGGQFVNSAGGGTDSAYLANGTYGIRAYGSYMGGYVSNTLGDSYAQLGLNGGFGVLGYGSTSGGYFKDNTSQAYAYVGNAGYGIKGFGTGLNGVGGYLENGSAYAVLGTGVNSGFGGPFGIKAVSPGGTAQGYWAGDFVNSYSGVFARLAYSSGFSNEASISGNAAKNFIQNHPSDASKLISYSSLEGDEVGTYTRGSGRLVHGEALIALGETFQWVTNPDVGLTAQVTARGSSAVLYVDTLSTTQLVVRSASGDPNAAFDYVVNGLRLGFEQSPTVADRSERTDAKLPSVSAAERELAKRPDLQTYTPLSRFRRMSASAGFVSVKDDMARGLALRKAIGEYDRDRDREALAGPDPAAVRKQMAPPPLDTPLAPGSTTTASSTVPAAIVPAVDAGPRATQLQIPAPLSAQMGVAIVEVAEDVEAGTVLAADAANPVRLRAAAAPADPLLAGVVVAPDPTTHLQPGQALIALAGSIVECRADATHGPIRAGDRLTSSPTPGYAMRSPDDAPGTVLGKALEALDAGTGVIRILVMAR